MRFPSILFIGCMLVTTMTNAAEFQIFRSDSQVLIVSMTGNIEENDPQKLQTIFGSNPFSKEKFLVLNSFGGLVDAGIEMGLVVSNYGVRTIIPKKGRCFSACSMVFVAGWDDIRLTPARYKYVQHLLGVHRPHNVNFKSADLHVMNAVRSYFEFMETGKAFYRLTASIPPRKMRFIKNIKPKVMSDYKVVGLSKTQKTSKVSKRRPQKSFITKQQHLEKWRRSLLESSD